MSSVAELKMHSIDLRYPEVRLMRFLPVWLLAGTVLTAPALQAAATADEQNTMAIWKEQRIDFYYHSSTAIYSCSALRGRIVTILNAVGARDDLQVDSNNCDEMLSPPAQTMPSFPDRQSRSDDMFRNRQSRGEQYAHVRIFVKTPTEATPEAMAALKKDKPRRELIAKVTGKPEAAVEAETQFQAQRQQITLSRDSIGLDASECELLDQLVTTVFADLKVRVLSRDYSCSPGHTSKIPPKMTVEALVPVVQVAVPQIEPGSGDATQPSKTESAEGDAPEQSQSTQK
jgi:hypothetical protein